MLEKQQPQAVQKGCSGNRSPALTQPCPRPEAPGVCIGGMKGTPEICFGFKKYYILSVKAADQES